LSRMRAVPLSASRPRARSLRLRSFDGEQTAGAGVRFGTPAPQESENPRPGGSLRQGGWAAPTV
jgi:hypothetical protein